MPNYSPFCSLKLLANAHEAKDEKPLEMMYAGFWDTFYKAPKENSLRCMLRALFAGLGIKKPIIVVSVFGTVHLQNIQKERDAIYVGFSGEPHSLNTDWFHINLIMEPTCLAKNIVGLPNFITNAYEFGIWPYLTSPRPEYPVSKKKFCTFVVRNGGCYVRNQFMQMLAQYKKVDCAGPHMNNIGQFAPEDEFVYGDAYLGFLQKYKFVICFENCKKPAYVTEKILNAYMAGCIPIYWGSLEALEWFNPKSFLFLENESTEAMQRLVEKVMEVDQNDDLYQQYFREPLVSDKGIPKEWEIDTIREHIRHCLEKQGLLT